MTGLLSADRFQPLVMAAAGSAYQELLFDRDETDSYCLRLEVIQGRQVQLGRADVMPALPIGSRWTGAIGWESYVLFPVSHRVNGLALAIAGLEYVIEHPTRGAYVVFGGVVIPVAAVQGIASALADRLHLSPGLQVQPTRGVVISRAMCLEEHRKAAAWILRAGGASYSLRKLQIVRTVLMTQDEVPSMRSVLSLRPVENYLVGVVPPIRDHFTRTANTMLGLLSCRWYHGGV